MSARGIRPRAGFCRPKWEGVFKSYSIKFIKENRWRCDPTINEFPDLLQDAYLVFHKVMERYPRVTEPRHFMSLYKTALFNEFMDKARYRQHKDAVHVAPSEEVFDFYANRIGDAGNAGYLSALLDEAPEELKLVMDVLANNKIKPRPRIKRPKMQARENLNGKIRNYCKKLGVAIEDPLGDLSRLLRYN